MTNSITGFGLKDYRRRDGGAPTMGQEGYFIGSSDTALIFNGDLVQLILESPATGASGSFITQASTGVAASPASYGGVFRGCKYYNASMGRTTWSPYWPGATAAGTSSATGDATAFVVTDDQMLFLIRGSSALTYGSSYVGMNVTISATSSQGNTANGMSVVTLSTLAPATTSSFPLRIYGYAANDFPPGEAGTDMTSVNPIVIVAPNNWSSKNTTGI